MQILIIFFFILLINIFIEVIFHLSKIKQAIFSHHFIIFNVLIRWSNKRGDFGI